MKKHIIFIILILTMVYTANSFTTYYFYSTDDFDYVDTSDDEGGWHEKFSGIDVMQGNITTCKNAIYFDDLNKGFNASIYDRNATQNWTESTFTCSDVDGWNNYGVLNTTELFINDEMKYYYFNVTGDLTKGVKRAYNNGEENITFYLPLDGGSTCFSFDQPDLDWRSKAYPNGKTLNARQHEFTATYSDPMLICNTDYNPCNYVGGDWVINCSLNCEFDTMEIPIESGYDIIMTGSGTVKFINSIVSGYKNVLIQDYCQGISINSQWVSG